MAEASSSARRGEALARTYLANERTELAWWRTGFTVLAVALGGADGWCPSSPTARQVALRGLGLAYALYGIALIVYGTARSRAVDAALWRGEYQPSTDLVVAGDRRRRGGARGPDRRARDRIS